MAEPLSPPASPDDEPENTPVEGEAETGKARRRSMAIPWILTVALAAFALGLLANPWFEANIRRHLPQPLRDTPSQQDHSRIAALESRMEMLEADLAVQPLPANAQPPVSGTPGEIEARITRIEALEAFMSRAEDADAGLSARIHQLSGELQTLASNSSVANRQARELLLLATARRFIETGRPLGWVGDAIGREFSGADESVMAALNAWSDSPQSIRLLQRHLSELTAPPAPAQVPDGNWWERLVARLTTMVTVRRDAIVEEKPAALAQAALEGGDVALAITQVESVPPSPERDAWLAAARRLEGARAALETLESRVLETVASTQPPPPPPAAAEDVPPPVNAPESMNMPPTPLFR